MRNQDLKIISGGQTGNERAALDWAIKPGIPEWRLGPQGNDSANRGWEAASAEPGWALHPRFRWDVAHTREELSEVLPIHCDLRLRI